MGSKPKILLTGANGMLGQMLYKTLEPNYQVIPVDKQELNMASDCSIFDGVHTYMPNIIINAAAYTAVDDCEVNVELANSINGDGLKYLAQAAKEVGATLIHYSTDYIFNGQKKTGYPEDYPEVKPINAYGASKALGEKNIQATIDQHYILRTAWLYGPHGNNFVDTMRQLGQEKDQLKVVNDQHGSPTFTKDLAERTKYIIEHSPEFGIYHITNSGSCTWYEFAKEIFILSGITIHLQPCTTEEFPRPAKRPKYSMLLNTKLPVMRSWQEALQDYLLNF